MNSKFDYAIINSIENAIRTVKASPLVLGGTEVGSGGAIGGIVGYLPQRKVSYDIIEAESDAIPASGKSIITNLNHIRNRIAVLESGSASSFLDLTDTPATYSGSIGKSVVVNSGGTGLEFSSSTAGQLEIDSYRFGFVTNYSGLQQTILSYDKYNTIELTPVDSLWEYYRNGQKCIVSGVKSCVLSATPPAADGLYYISIDSTDGELISSTNEWSFEDTRLPVATVYAYSGVIYSFLTDNRYSCSLDRRYDWRNDKINGVDILNIPTISGYSILPISPTNSGVSFGLSSSTLIDNDIKTNIYELADISSDYSSYNMVMRSAGSTFWQIYKYSRPYRYLTSICYDNNGTLTSVPSGYFVNCYIIASNTIDRWNIDSSNYFTVMGQAAHSTIESADIESFSDLNLDGFPFARYVAIYKLTLKSDTSFTNYGKYGLAKNPEKIYVTNTGFIKNMSKQVVPANEAGAANNFLSAYNNLTGAWTKEQPTWANIDKTTSDIANITTKSHTSLSNIGTNTHANIDTHIANTSNPHAVTAAQVGAGAYTDTTAWMVNVYGATTRGTCTYTTREANYARVGNMVFISLYVNWTGHTGTGNMRLDVLPVAATSTSALSVYFANITLGAVGNKLMATTSIGATYITITQVGSGAATAVPMDAAGVLFLSGFYFV